MTTLCTGIRSICAGEDLLADGQVKTGTVESGHCNQAGDICAGDDLIADDVVLAGFVESPNCVTAGNICAGVDLGADYDVYAGSGCVHNGAGRGIAGSCASDGRLNENITPFAPVLAQLTALQPATFDWRTEEFPELRLAREPGMGLTAQEVEQVLPGLVTENERGYKAVRYSLMALLLLQGVKDLNAENAALQVQMQEKDDRVASLEARLAALERLVGTGQPLVQALR